MLNISEKSINQFVQPMRFRAFQLVEKRGLKRLPLYISLVVLLIFFVSIFLPWTQNIQTKGYVTTLRPEHQPQAIQSVISGKLEQWFVREGNYVEKGDTIVFISEVKSEYFDPNLVERTTEQVTAKTQSIQSYGNKVRSLESQYEALVDARNLKLEQTKNKIQQARLKVASDSMDLVAAKTNRSIAENQFNRTSELYDKGLKSLTDLEDKKLKLQSTQAKVLVQENKFLTRRNELQNLRIQLPTIESEYADKMAKSQSDKFTALSNKLDATANTSKLQNQLSNYSQRQKLYYITAPQSGYITKAVKKGIGEIIKEGADIVTIVPDKYDLAVEIYVKPRDLPLLEIGNAVRLQFDGWPAIVFSGWPNSSLGTFSGKVIAIDRYISSNGNYRLLVVPEVGTSKGWPSLLRVGSGAKAFMLLNNVPIWYEIWRQLNGFPPDFYEKGEKETDIKRKAPIKSIK